VRSTINNQSLSPFSNTCLELIIGAWLHRTLSRKALDNRNGLVKLGLVRHCLCWGCEWDSGNEQGSSCLCTRAIADPTATSGLNRDESCVPRLSSRVSILTPFDDYRACRATDTARGTTKALAQVRKFARANHTGSTTSSQGMSCESNTIKKLRLH